MKKVIVKRNDLYQKVWSKPMTKITAEYRISDKGLAKICAKLNIPRLEVCNWNKLNAANEGNCKRLPPLIGNTLYPYMLNGSEQVFEQRRACGWLGSGAETGPVAAAGISRQRKLRHQQ